MAGVIKKTKNMWLSSTRLRETMLVSSLVMLVIPDGQIASCYLITAVN